MKQVYFLLIFLFAFNLLLVGQTDSLIYERLYDQPLKEIVKNNGDIYLKKDFAAYLSAFSMKEDASEILGEEQQKWLSYLNQPHPDVKTLHKYFSRYARAYDVPKILLMAIAYVETNFTQIGPSIDQGWGMMHLVQNDYCNTLSEAAGLIHHSPGALKNNAILNIEGAAALINYYGMQMDDYPESLEEWFQPAKEFSGLGSDKIRELQARKYFEIVQKGVTTTTLWGEKVHLQDHPKVSIQSKLKYQFRQGGKAVDYPSAVDVLTSCNFSSRNGTNVDTYVHHYIGTGTVAGAISWFQNCDANVSAHFIIEEDGTVYQSVRTDNKAWHCGAAGYPNNSRSIGTEHDATVTHPERWNSPEMLQASADLTNYFCDQYEINKERTDGPGGICGHDDMPGTNTDCPGPLPWDTWLAYFHESSDNQLPQPEEPTSGETGVSKPVAFQWDSPVEGSSFRIQVAENPEGWTAENGFTADTDTSSQVVVNAGTGNTYFTWGQSTPNTFSSPELGRRYWWTIRGWESEAGLTNYTSPRSFTLKYPEGVTPIDQFEKDRGHFTASPAYSGSSTGISSSSTASHALYMAENGEGSLRIELEDEATSSENWTVRLLSGMGNPNNNTAFPSKGAITFQMATSTAQDDAEISIWIDDQDGIESLEYQGVTNNGAWNKYSFPLLNDQTSAITGNGTIDADRVTIDAILLKQSESAENWVVYIDELRHDSTYIAPALPVASFEAQKTRLMEGDSTHFINLSENASDYHWTFEGGSPNYSVWGNPTITYDTPGTYEVTLKAINETGSDVATKESYIHVAELPPVMEPPAISYVTVNNQKNTIAWNPVAQEALTQEVRIYKETNAAGTYELIGSVNPQDSSFVDEASHPRQRAARYRITLLDTLERETLPSEVHKTIHLTVNKGIHDSYNLLWDAYEGLEFDSYVIFKGTSKDNLIQIDQIQNTLFSYTDQPVENQPVYYAIGLSETGLTKKTTLGANQSLSNLVRIDEHIDNLIYPNPAEDMIFVRTNKFTSQKVLVEIFSTTGKLIKEQWVVGSQEISVEDLDTGLYLIKATDGTGKTTTVKLMKQ